MATYCSPVCYNERCVMEMWGKREMLMPMMPFAKCHDLSCEGTRHGQKLGVRRCSFIVGANLQIVGLHGMIELNLLLTVRS